jgi:Lsr2
VARKEVVKFIDDLDGEVIDRGGQTFAFAYRGAQYEIDLGERNAQKFAEALEPYVAAARRIGDERPKAPSSVRIDRTQLAAMRSWAKNHGYQVSDRGRVSQEIQDAYHSAK